MSDSAPPLAEIGSEQHTDAGVEEAVRNWMRKLAPYCDPDPKRSLFELLITAVPFAGLWTAQALLLNAGHWWALALSLPAAAFLVRLFMIQHDCGHGSYFRSKWANDLVGRIIGVWTLTPYDYWRRTHAEHHATAGNLDRRGTGDVDLLTVAEYRALPRWRRVTYRLTRHPVVLLGIGPFYLFVLKYRLPAGLMREDDTPWISTMATNLAIAAFVLLIGFTVGFGTYLMIQLPITLISGAAGVWLFYVQHQFETTYWQRDPRWSFHVGAVFGSTHYELPGPLRWFTANIGIHHVHHLVSRIPCYRLGDALKDHPELRSVGRLTLRESLQCFRLKLWDEGSRRLIAFRDLRRLPS